jgi:hypothetical protein
MANEQNLAPAWQPGQSGNPGGKTSDQRQRELRNADMATRIQEFLLEREVAAIEEPADVGASEHVRAALADVLSPRQLATVLSTLNIALTAERLKLIKDAQDRGLGAPTQTIDNTHDVSDRLKEAELEFTGRIARVASRSGTGGDHGGDPA